MADGYRPPEGFMTVGEAQQRLGVSKVTISKIVREAGLQTYRDPRNARVRLLRVGDVERLEQPVLEAEEGKAQAA
jgi:excisionase family DNA binding protein